MIIESNFSINIAKDKTHFLKIELGGMLRGRAIRKFEDTCERFPASEGFENTLSYIRCFGVEVANNQNKEVN